MSRNKTWLVAHREFLENVRTKTFWIGIIFVPIIIAASIAIPAWLDKAKDVRKYAVIDESGWLLPEIDAHASMPDMEKVLSHAVESYREKDDDFEELPEFLKESARALVMAKDQLTDAQLREIHAQFGEDADPLDKLIQAAAEALAMLNSPEHQGLLDSPMVPEEARTALREQLEQLRDWWQSLPPEEARKFGSRLSRSRYQRVPLPDLEGDALFEELNRRINDEELFAYFVIGKDPVASSEGCRYVSNNLTDDDLKDWFSRHATEVVQKKRIEEEGIDPEVARKIQEPLRFEAKKLSETGEEEEVSKEDAVKQFAPVAFVYLLWIAIFTVVQMLLTNTIEEKSNRILEVLLSSVSPLQLMIGKIAGIAMTGMTVVTSWVVCFVVMVRYIPTLIGGELGFDLMSIARDPLYLASFLVYFFLGYLLYAAILVGIGSVCNSIKEANNLMMPVTVVLMIPLLAMVPISQDPNGSLAVFMTYIPPFTPFVMMNRAAGPPATIEYVITTVLILVSIAGAMWAAAKVFRIGILMTGKAPTPMEILRWIKAPVGQVPVRKQE